MKKQAKKKGWWLLAVLALALAMLPVTGDKAWAEEEEPAQLTDWKDSNGVQYEKIDNKDEVMVLGYMEPEDTSLAIETLTIPSKVKIEDGTKYTVTEIANGAFGGRSKLTSITLPSSLTSIGYGAFQGCTGLTSIKLPSSLTSIGNSAFSGCSGLESVDMLQATELKSIGENAFQNCTSLTGVIVPDSVTTIGQSAFYGCSQLGNVTLPKGLKIIESNLFNRCYSLTSIKLPAGVTEIGQSAFYNCYNLKSVDMSLVTELKSIGKYAFIYCENLESITLPAKVESIGVGAFMDCEKLCVNITGNISSEKIGEGALNDVKQVTCTNPEVLQNLVEKGVVKEDSAIYYLSTVEISLTPDKIIYTNQPITPEVKLTAGEITFTKDIDYTLEYVGNEWPGLGWVTITPTGGRLCGEPQTAEFTIYGVFFSAGGDSSEEVIWPTADMVNGLTLTLPGRDSDFFTAPEGQRLKNWEIRLPRNSGFETVYMNPGETYNLQTEFVDIFAVWEDIPTYTVTIDPGEGSGTKKLVTVTEGGKYKLPACDFTAPEGMKFKAWQIGGTEYAVGTEIAVDGNVTITAVWVGDDNPDNPDNPGEEENPGDDDTEKPGGDEDPGDTENPTKPTDPSNPTDPTDPSKPVDPAKPTTPTKPEGSKYYTITYDTDGGTLVNITGNTDYVIWGKEHKMPSATKSRYTFLHWAIGAKNSTNTVNANEVYTFTADTTVYAIWEYTGGGGHSSRPSSSGSGGTTTPVKPEKPGTTNPGTPGTSSNTVTAANINNVFADVKNNAWYAEAIAYVYNKGIMNGTGNGQFEPNFPTTRAMLVTMLHRLEKEPGAGTINFGDVASGQWYSQAIAWAAANGIVKGYSDTQFAPNDEITREQLAVILYRYAQFKGLDVSARGDLSSFRDSQNVSDWAKEAMEWAVGAGIINGNDNGNIAPTANATRAEVAMMLMRYLEK